MSLPAILLRPRSAAQSSMERLRAAGIADIRSVPLFRLVEQQWTAPDVHRLDRLLLTSAAAVELAGEQLAALQPLPCWCVGEATAQAARDAGLKVAHVGNSGGQALLDESEGEAVRWLWLAGAVRQPLYVRLPGTLTTIACYDSRPLAIAEEDALALMDPCVILVHSAATAERLSLLVQDRSAAHLVAISRQVAEAAQDGWASIEVAATPQDAEMVALAVKLCQNPAHD